MNRRPRFNYGPVTSNGVKGMKVVGRYPAFSKVAETEGVVIDRFFTDDERNRSQTYVEYNVRDIRTGQIYYNCRYAHGTAGQTNGTEDILQPATQRLPGNPGPEDFNPQTSPLIESDGDRVLIAFVHGAHHSPVITNVLPHRRSEYGAKREDGQRKFSVHQGLSVEVSKIGEYTITHKSGSVIKMLDNGDVQVLPADGRDAFIGATTATENLVLGQAFKTFATDLINALLAATYPTGTGPSGMMNPPQSTTLATLRDALDDLLSDMAFTQKEVP